MGKIEVADSFVKTSDESANLPEIAVQYLEFISKERRLSVYTSRNYRHSIILFFKWLSGINQNITFQPQVQKYIWMKVCSKKMTLS